MLCNIVVISILEIPQLFSICQRSLYYYTPTEIGGFILFADLRKWSMQSQSPCRRVGLENGRYSAARNSRLQRTHKRSKYNQSS